MNGLGKRASFLAIVALIAVSLCGAGYGLWQEELAVKAEVKTGTFGGTVVCAGGADNEAPGWPKEPPYTSYPSLTPPKNIAGGGVQQADIQHLQVILDKAYPGYAFRCEVRVKNTGTVDWHLEHVSYDVQKCAGDGTHCVALLPGPGPVHRSWKTACDGSVCPWGNLGVSPPSDSGLPNWSPIYASVKDQEGCEVHATDPDLAAWLLVGLNRSAEENSVYKVAVSYQLVPWNVSKWAGCTEPRTP